MYVYMFNNVILMVLCSKLDIYVVLYFVLNCALSLLLKFRLFVYSQITFVLKSWHKVPDF